MTHQGRFGPKAKAFYRWKEAFKLYIKLNIPDDWAVLADPATVSWTAYFTIPVSYSKKKAATIAGEVHRVKPDRDNVDKAILDSLTDQDQRVSDGFLRKRWDDGRGARIELDVS